MRSPLNQDQLLAEAQQHFPHSTCRLDADGLVIRVGRAGLRLKHGDDGVWALRMPGDAMTFQGYSIGQAVQEARMAYAQRLATLERLDSSWPSTL